MTPQERQMLTELYQFMQSLKNSTTIPLEIDQAFKGRFNTLQFTDSGLGSSAHRQAVNESGSSTYNVLPAATGFDKRTDGTTVKYYPYY